MSDREIDEHSGTETTGHEWDGIRELNTPMPRWWLTILYATIIWAIGYMLVYPAWPLVSSYTKGFFEYSSRAEVAKDIAIAKEAQKADLDKLATASLEEIRTDADMLEFAMAGGRAAFNVNCSQCHGSGAQGFVGYPNLNDDEWLWGGTLDDIHLSITHGIRNDDDDDAHQSDMPAFLKDELLGKAEISDVAEFVLSLSNSSTDAAAVDRGAPMYKENCADCHGEKGAGNAELGAPALDNKIWLYGGDKTALVESISFSRKGVMPAWGQKLDPIVVKQLTIYVHSLGGGN